MAPQAGSSWTSDENMALLTDLYELTMLQAYHVQGMHEHSVFSLFVRKLPRKRNYLIACGLDQVLDYLEKARFTPESLDYLSGLGRFGDDFLQWLGDFRFQVDVRAMPEGTPFFPDEPVIEVAGPISQAQLAETFIMNQVHYQVVAASKASRVVDAAGDRAAVVDFGLRRIPCADAGLKSARAFHVAGVKATSNVLAGSMFGIPVTGTMAHSYIQAHDSEYRAMENFARIYPETILLVDTYDTLEGVGKVVELAKRLGRDFKVSGVRLDSGDMADLARESRQILDRAGLHHVSIFASGSMDEYEIARLLDSGAPIDGFGVGTHMGVSDDSPYLDMVYKLTSHAGKGRLKTSPGKKILPGAKQVYRMEDEAEAVRDVIAGYDEDHPGRPLLVPVMENGRRLPAGLEDLDAARQRRVRELAALPDHVRGMDPADPPYQVEVSRELGRRQKELIKELTA